MGPFVDPAAVAAQRWFAALRTGDLAALVATTALPFTYRTANLSKSCDGVARNPRQLRRWAACVHRARDLRLAELAAWRDFRIYRGLPPSGVAHLMRGLGDGYWVQGFASDEAITFGIAFLVVSTTGGFAPEAPVPTLRLRACVVDAGRA